MTYHAESNSIVDAAGKQIAVVLPSNCSRLMAVRIAALAAAAMNKTSATGAAP